MAVVGTLFSAILLVFTAVCAGPLWRDELNTANLARLPTLQELWRYSSCESFPPLWPLLLRGCDWLGLTGSDERIRLLGLYVGFLMLGSWWLCARWMRCRAPILSIALLGSLPAFVFTVGANRAYGLASCFLVLSFGAIWRMVESPTRARIFIAAVSCFIFAHCVYYDAIFLGAMIGGAGLVTLRRRQWKTLITLAVIGAACMVSTFIYLPIIRGSSAYVEATRWPDFTAATLWNCLCQAVTARSSSDLGPNGVEIWLWIALLFCGLAAAVVAQWTRSFSDSSQEAAFRKNKRADLALFCAVSMTLGVLGMLGFWYWLQFLVQKWYCVEMLCLCAISLDGLLGANWPELRPWGLLRVGLLVVIMSWCGASGWKEAHTRRTNVDLVAAVLEANASTNDFIVVQTAWEGISFFHYYHGTTPWVTVPPMDSHLVHRNDLMADCMKRPEVMTPVLSSITNTLHDGHYVWLVGNLTRARPEDFRPTPSSKWLGTILYYWRAQVSATVLDHASQEQLLEIPITEPVCSLENLPVVRISGFTGVRTNDLPAN
jgi:hypothetical protein